MVCLYCDGSTRVINSRPQKRLNRIWRRRQCAKCQATFTTIEGAALSESLVTRTPAKTTLTPFLRDKLYLSVYNSLQHRDNAIQDATGLTDTIMSQLSAATAGGIVHTDRLVIITHDVLKHFDTAAAVHYAAFHKI